MSYSNSEFFKLIIFSDFYCSDMSLFRVVEANVGHWIKCSEGQWIGKDVYVYDNVYIAFGLFEL